MDVAGMAREGPMAESGGGGSALGPLEAEVMAVLWRLAGKGILVREQQGRGSVYTPVVADTAEIAVRGVLAEFGDAALARFVDRVELDPRLRARLRKLMGATS